MSESAPDGNRPALTISQASKAAGVDRRTIRRRLDAGNLPGAYRPEPGAPWLLPVADLLAAGLRLHAPNDTGGDAHPAATPPPTPAQPSELEEWRRRAEVAEAIAEERAEVIAVLKTALAALGPGPVPPAGSPTPAPTAAQAPPPARPRWWRRR